MLCFICGCPLHNSVPLWGDRLNSLSFKNLDRPSFCAEKIALVRDLSIRVYLKIGIKVPFWGKFDPY